MATLLITEFQYAGSDGAMGSLPVPMEPPLAEQSVSFTTATQSSAFNGSTRFVRLIATANCHVAFGTNPTATAAKQKLIADQEYWRCLPPGATYKLSVYDGSS